MKRLINYEAGDCYQNNMSEKVRCLLMNFGIYKALFFLFIFLLASYFVGVRDIDDISDTATYVKIYNQIDIYFWEGLEYGFVAFAGAFSLFDLSYHYFFSGCFLLVSLFLSLTFLRINYNELTSSQFVPFFIFVGLLFSSSWFYTATTNGLRQGIALSILYFSLTFLFDSVKRRIVTFFVFFVISCFFHKTLVLLVPFLIPLFISSLSVRVYGAGFVVFGLFYFLGVNEWFVSLFSELVGNSIYKDVLTYCEHCWMEPGWFGFNYKFFLYTVFWFLVSFVFLEFGFIEREKEKQVAHAIKLYCLLAIFYFVFGFGGFANRWAMTAWLFIPVLQAVVLSSLNVSSRLKFIFALFMFCFYFRFLIALS